MKPDLKQLQALVAIARHGTLARAADALRTSPSALSMQLGGLQQRLGRVLLRRTGRGLVLTADGERLLPAARDAVAALARLLDEAAAPAGEGAAPAVTPQPVTLGTILDPDAIRLGELLRAVRQRLPEVHPELCHGISGWVMAELLAGRLDLGFGLGQPPPALRAQRLATVRYVVVAPRGWAARLHGASWEALAALPWITTPPESVHHQLLQPLWARLGRAPRTVARVDQEASMVDLVRAGFGLSLAREAVALREADEAGLALWRAQPLDTALWLLARPDDGLAEARRTLVAQLFDTAAAIWPGGGSGLSP